MNIYRLITQFLVVIVHQIEYEWLVKVNNRARFKINSTLSVFTQFPRDAIEAIQQRHAQCTVIRVGLGPPIVFSAEVIKHVQCHSPRLEVVVPSAY